MSFVWAAGRRTRATIIPTITTTTVIQTCDNHVRWWLQFPESSGLLIVYELLMAYSYTNRRLKRTKDWVEAIFCFGPRNHYPTSDVAVRNGTVHSRAMVNVESHSESRHVHLLLTFISIWFSCTVQWKQCLYRLYHGLFIFSYSQQKNTKGTVTNDATINCYYGLLLSSEEGQSIPYFRLF